MKWCHFIQTGSRLPGTVWRGLIFFWPTVHTLHSKTHKSESISPLDPNVFPGERPHYESPTDFPPANGTQSEAGFISKYTAACSRILPILSSTLWRNRRDGLVVGNNERPPHWPDREVAGLVVEPGGRGFEPRPGHTKDFKFDTYCLLVICSAFKNGEGKLNTRSYQWTNPLL